MSHLSPTKTFAAFASDLEPASIPQGIKDTLGILLLDHVRVSSMGARLPWADWARAYIKQVAAPGNAHVLFSKERLNAQHAAYLNVAYGGSFDADDTHVGGMLHPGIIMWSVTLALAEETGASGSEVLAAVTAGYEVMIRTALAMQPGHFKRGYQSSGTCGPIGAAAAASRLLFKGPERAEQTAKAIGLAAGFSGGVVQYYYSGGSAKRIQPGHAAQSGIEAALLAQAGFDGPTDILEGQGGFFRAYSDELDVSHVFDGLGERFHIADILVKGYAAAARVHSAVEAMFDLRCKHDFTGDDIESIYVGIPKVIQGRLTNRHPNDIQAAQMSLPFSVALASRIALPAGEIPVLTVSHYLEHIHSPAVGAIEDRLKMEVDPQVEAASGKQSTAAKLEVRLKDGREVSAFVSAPKGSQSRPFTRDEHLSRFKQELSTRISCSACAEIIAAASDLEQLDASWLGRKLAGA